MTSDLLASSPITHQPKNFRYDVFLSFRGEDTRNSFVSHLHGDLSNHQIKTFIDYNLPKGDDFPPALLTAIEESSIAIIIFSENYADSTWCLKELAKIMECKNSNDQIVLPVFYGVDPSHVRNQTGNFGVAFDRLQECSKGKMNFDKARSHLMEVGGRLDPEVPLPECEVGFRVIFKTESSVNKFFDFSRKAAEEAAKLSSTDTSASMITIIQTRLLGAISVKRQ